MEQTINSVARKEGAFEKRIHEVDFLRGVCMFLVFMDHLFWCFSYYFPKWGAILGNQTLVQVGNSFVFYWNHPARYVVQFFCLAMFLFLSGVSCAFSKNNNKRAVVMVIFYFVLLLGSNIVNGFITGSGYVINWNVIANVAFSVLFYCLFQKCSTKALWANTLFLLLCYFAIIPCLFWYVGNKATFVPALWGNNTYSAVYGTSFWNPSWPPLYTNGLGTIYVNGIFYTDADYMSFFPFVIFFFFGAIFSRYFYKSKKSLIKHKGNWERPVCFVGRHSLLFYVGSMAVYLAIFMAIDACIK